MPQILLIGAGTTGLVLACELRRQGVEVRLIDSRSSGSESMEPLILSVPAQQSLARMGLGEVLGDILSAVRFDLPGKGETEISFDTQNSATRIPRSVFEEFLVSRLKEEGIEVEWNTRLTNIAQGANSISVLLEKLVPVPEDSEYEDEEPEIEQLELPVAWVLACDEDGAALRDYLGLDANAAETSSEWYAADVRLKQELAQDAASLILHEKGPVFSLPLGEERVFLRASVQRDAVVEDPLDAEEDSEPAVSEEQQSEAGRKHELRRIIQERLGKSQDVLEFISLDSYGFAERNLESYRVGRIFFLGSVACRSSAWSLDETSAGIEDARNLAWKLALVVRGMGIEHILLESYSKERRVLNQRHLDRKRGVEIALTVDNPRFSSIRNALLPLLLKPSFLKRKFRDAIFAPRGFYESSMLNYVGEGVKGKGVRSGEPLPNFNFASKDGEEFLAERLFEIPAHVLFLYGNSEKYAELKDAAERAFRGMLVAYIVGTEDEESVEGIDLVDKEGAFAKSFGVQAPFCVAVRPDMYVAYLGLGYSRARVLAHLGSYLQFQEEV